MRLLFFILCFTSFAQASEHARPLNQCWNNSCEPESLRIWTAFEQSTEFTKSALNRVYSGVCYHRNSQYDPRHPHYGALFTEEYDGQIYMSARFGFFYEQNPYAAWTPADAQKEMPPKRELASTLTVENDYAWADFNREQAPMWQYFLRTNAEQNKIYLIGFWGSGWTLFCDFDRNLVP